MPITRSRVIEFSETSDGKTFFINRKQYQHDRIDTEVKLGDIEEWTVRNVTGERHVFHIHQLDFLVKEINPDDQDSTGLRDTIDVPYQIDGVPGEVKLIVPFTNPNIVGKFVYHCHILEHADNGMMANIVVKK
jgi:suppressor of ftsI